MRVRILKSLIIFALVFNATSSSAFADTINFDINTSLGSMFSRSESDQIITISSPNGDISFTDAGGGTVGILASTNKNLQLEINTASDKGVRISGNTAIHVRHQSLLNLDLISGIVTSDYSDSADGAIWLQNSGAGTNNIVLDAGTTISNTAATDGNAIHYSKTTSDVAELVIDNSGTIQVNDHSNSVAVFLEDSSNNSTLTLTNRSGGKIGLSSAPAPTSSVKAINVTGSNVATITNAGIINGSITALNGLTTITNSSGGVINGNINLGSHSSSVLTTSGTINGNVTLGSGQTVNLNAGSTTGVINGSAGGRGTVNTGSGIVTVSSDIGVTNYVDSFNVGSGSQTRLSANIYANTINLNGELDLLSSSGNILSADIIGNGSSGGAGNLNLGTYSHEIDGDLTLGAGDILSVAISTPSSAGAIMVDGLASINANTLLRVTLTGGTTQVGSSYIILTGGTGSSVNQIDDANISLNGATNRFGAYLVRTEVSGNSLLLKVFANYTPEIASNGSQLGAYDNIAGISSATGSLLVLKNYLESNTGASGKSAALNSVTAQVDNSSNRISFNNINNSANLVFNRLDNLRQNSNKISGLSSGDKSLNRAGWGEVFGSTASQGNTSDSSGYKAGTAGFAAGYDKKIDKELLLGVGVIYSSSNIKGSDGLKKTNIDNYQFNLYSGHNFDQFFINNVAGFGFNRYHSSRSIPVAGVMANAKYNGKTYMARSEIGTNHKLENDFILTPTLMITGARNTIDRYEEGGAGTLNLNVKNNSTNFLEGRVGTAISKNYSISDKIIVPSFSVSYGYDFIGSKQKTSANFIGQSSTFSSSGAKIAQGSLRLGAGLKLYQIDYFTLSADYGFEHRSKFDSHTGSLRGRYSF